MAVNRDGGVENRSSTGSNASLPNSGQFQTGAPAHTLHSSTTGFLAFGLSEPEPEPKSGRAVAGGVRSLDVFT